MIHIVSVFEFNFCETHVVVGLDLPVVFHLDCYWELQEIAVAFQDFVPLLKAQRRPGNALFYGCVIYLIVSNGKYSLAYASN